MNLNIFIINTVREFLLKHLTYLVNYISIK